MGRYQIKPGENLTVIAKKLGVSVDYLVTKNNIKNPNYIRAYDYLYY